MTDPARPSGDSPDSIAREVDRILAEATLAEKVAMMSGKGFFKAFAADGRIWAARPYRAGGGLDRLGVPALWFTDGPRGVARGQSTCFPCTMARGASFDVALERRIGEVMGIETRAQGCNLSGAVCVNLLRHPAWGRAQETYGEDPVHLAEMGIALGTGIQAHNVIATVKHLALNSIENSRFRVDVQIDERALHEVYLPHFREILGAGIKSVMSAYNKMNGEYCGQHRQLLTDILRGEWGFAGFVHSDWVMGVYQPYGAAAGLDIENPEPRAWGDKLRAAVEAGTIEPAVIDTACRRILTTLLRVEAAEAPLPDYPESLVSAPAHVALALEAAEKSAVLLENDGALPLDRVALRKLAVLGRLAVLENTGDFGSSRVRARQVITPLAGLVEALGADAILTGDENDLAAAATAAAAADAVVIVVGTTADEEGEYIPGDLNLGQGGEAPAQLTAKARDRGGDRADLRLPPPQVDLIKAAARAAAGKPVIVVIVSGSAIMVEEWRSDVSAILQSFYAGMAGGRALARLLLGDVSPSGRLPFSVARDASHYPHFDAVADSIVYDLWHGYPKLLRDAVSPRYGFGHGLSYARFDRRALRAERAGDTLRLSVAVRNDGTMAAGHVVLFFAEAPARMVERWPRKLIAFARVDLQPDETRIVTAQVPISRLQYRDGGRWLLEPGDYHILSATDAADPAPLIATLRL
ncbi:beta-glucosidase [Sandarakinorhabdus sp.]|uniref:beta-glucosidase family protein n=1 Tax=Sandarakinorhabdus sp. TaxID=1916663 RepID=UPI003F71B00F